MTAADPIALDTGAPCHHRPHDLTVSVTTEGPARCVHACGRLDWATVDTLRPALVACDDFTPVIIDLGELTSLDAAGTGLVVSSLAHLTGRGHTVVLAARHPAVREVLSAVRICDLAPLAASVEEAGRMVRAGMVS